MFETVDRKYYNNIRLGAIVFATVVVLFLLVDYLAFSSKEKGVEAAIVTSDLSVEEFDDSTLKITIPLIIKNHLALAITPGKFEVRFGGKNIKPRNADFSVGAGESDTISLPLVFDLEEKDLLHKPVELTISLETGIFYRNWDINYSGKISPDSVLDRIMSETIRAFTDNNEHIKGKYKEEGGNLKATVSVKNPFSYSVKISFDEKIILNTGSGTAINVTEKPLPVEIHPMDSAEIKFVFPHKTEKPTKDKDKSKDKSNENKHSKSFEITGNLVVKVLDMERNRRRSISLIELGK
ncbi:MAG: hypothetical protein LCH52_00165 [Bacteroidetes bacterium]|nr:hypothetical protein [Bacteroidota bacterium]